jgi:DNA-binding MarR family transcriptional regulator
MISTSPAAYSAGINKPAAEMGLRTLAKTHHPVTAEELARSVGYHPRSMYGALVQLEQLGYVAKVGIRDRCKTYRITQAGTDAQTLIDLERNGSTPPAPEMVVPPPDTQLVPMPEPTRKDLAAAIWSWMEDMGRADLEALSLRQLRNIHAAVLGLDQ